MQVIMLYFEESLVSFRMQVLVFFLVSCCFINAVVSRDICIVTYESTCTNCTQCDESIILEDLSRLLEDASVSERITIFLCSAKISLASLISIRDISSVFITSCADPSVIVCEGINTGIKLLNVRDLMLGNIVIEKCGAEHESTSVNRSNSTTNVKFKTSVYILNCSDITIEKVNIRKSDGIGLTIIDTNGSVLIENCTFEMNAVNNSLNGASAISGGNGMYIEFSYCTPGGLAEGNCNDSKNPLAQNSSYTIIDCTFKHNIASTIDEKLTSYVHASGSTFQGFGRGGGMCIFIRGHAEGNTINILNCSFINNSAIWGGGLNIAVHDSPTSNTINTIDSCFTDNVCTLNGGGGIDVGFLFSKQNQPKRNLINFNHCKISNNSADYGGGTLVYTSPSRKFTDWMNEINFESCHWKQNRAIFGAGINVGSHVWDTLKKGFRISPVFSDCLFESNYVDKNLNSFYHNKIEGKGTFIAVGIDIEFKGTTKFIQNNDTALYLVSSNAKFSSNSHVRFEGNKGKLGGAIIILGLASLEVSDNSTFNFTNNTAREKGGAIYQSSNNVNDYIVSRSCFIQYSGNTDVVEERQINFNFKDNTAGFSHINGSGPSIFASTLHPCYTGCSHQQENETYNETFDCIANFTFEREPNNYEISTFGDKLTSSAKNPMLIIPGGWINLPVKLMDELNNEVNTLYHLFITNESNNSNISLSSEYVSNKWVQLFGHPSDTATIRVETVEMWEVAFTMNVHMTECPPGYMYKEYSTVNKQEAKTCECSATSKLKLYTGITDCNALTFQAKMKTGYWFGYSEDINKTYGREQNLLSGYCPIGYCVYYESKALTLPNTTNINELDSLLCGNRTGILCGRCRESLAGHYHSTNYECKSTEKCNIGWLLYLTSEILPITAFFIVIVILDINFTNGAINGMIFYFQVTDISIHFTSGFVKCSSPLSNFLELYNFLIGIFNLKFFNHKDLSFCLWHKAQTLDLLVFKYITIIYSLLLVVTIISALRFCNWRRITRRIPKLCGRKVDIKSTTIHGLSGFLILCYSECTKICLSILTPVTLYTQEDSTTAVLFNGELKYFKGKHLAYALPALLFFILLGLVPPFLLFSYPLCYKIFGLLRISESKFVKVICTIVPLEKFKPFFDSFQSSFKDDFRFYSGLYFMYRLIILLTFSITRSLTNYYLVLIIEFTLILCLHAIIQPYKKKCHNVVDIFIFTTLILLNILTLYNYRRSLELLNNDYTIKVICVLQTVLLYIPLILFVSMLIVKVVQKLNRIKSKRSGKSDNIREQELSESLLFGRRGSKTD